MTRCTLRSVDAGIERGVIAEAIGANLIPADFVIRGQVLHDCDRVRAASCGAGPDKHALASYFAAADAAGVIATALRALGKALAPEYAADTLRLRHKRVNLSHDRRVHAGVQFKPALCNVLAQFYVCLTHIVNLVVKGYRVNLGASLAVSRVGL